VTGQNSEAWLIAGTQRYQIQAGVKKSFVNERGESLEWMEQVPRSVNGGEGIVSVT